MGVASEAPDYDERRSDTRPTTCTMPSATNNGARHRIVFAIGNDPLPDPVLLQQPVQPRSRDPQHPARLALVPTHSLEHTHDVRTLNRR